jgi:hypothetical protein
MIIVIVLSLTTVAILGIYLRQRLTLRVRAPFMRVELETGPDRKDNQSARRRPLARGRLRMDTPQPASSIGQPVTARAVSKDLQWREHQRND